MKKKVSADTQMMTYVEEELEIKRKLMINMKSMGKEHRQTMNDLSSSLKTLSDSIASAFSTLNQVLVRPSLYHQPLAPQPVASHPNYPHPHYPQHYDTHQGSPIIPATSPHFLPIPYPPSTQASSSISRISTPSPMTQRPQTSYDDVPALSPINFDDNDS